MKNLRFLLFPFGMIYYLVTYFRNLLFDFSIRKSWPIPLKSICVGNLSVGGTGKSPLVAYLAEHLSQEYAVQTLSRGYGRKTKGFHVVDVASTAENVGDEPLMYKRRFGDKLSVAVCESRKEGIEAILKQSSPDVLILDDAFQHRKVKAGLSILVTEYSKPFSSDYILPVGNLREGSYAKKRAQAILVSKCPDELTEEAKSQMIAALKFDKKQVYFSTIQYKDLISFSAVQTAEIEHVLLVTGIANPSPLVNYLKASYQVELMQFSDHHQFSLGDIEKIHKNFDTFAADKKAIVCSEKDYVRLVAPEFSASISEKPWYYQAISIQLDRDKEFLNQIKKYVDTI